MTGPVIDTVTHLLAGVMLLCAFALLVQRRLASALASCRMQALSLTAAAFWQAHVQGSGGLYLTGILTLGANAILIPILLRRLGQRLDFSNAPATKQPIIPTLIFAAAVTAAAVIAVPRISQTFPLTSEELAIALAILVLGLMMVAMRRDAFAQVIGFLVIDHALLLTAICLPAMPLVPEFCLALLALPALPIVIIFLWQAEDSAAPLDFSWFDGNRRRGR